MTYAGGQRCDRTRAGDDRHRPGEGRGVCHRLAYAKRAGWVLDVQVHRVTASCCGRRTNIPSYNAAGIATAVAGRNERRADR